MSTKTAQTYHVLMGDVTNSATRAAVPLADTLNTLTANTNTAYKADILSPLTVTLGDEFQGITASASATLDIIFHLETETRIQNLPPLHYAWVQGAIDTPINTKIAHGMLGPALTKARKLLTRKDRDRPKIQINTPDPDHTAALQNILIALTAISDRWNPRDNLFIQDLLSGLDVRSIAEIHDRDTSSIYRRRETLMIDPYLALQNAARTLTKMIDR